MSSYFSEFSSVISILPVNLIVSQFRAVNALQWTGKVTASPMNTNRQLVTRLSNGTRTVLYRSTNPACSMTGRSHGLSTGESQGPTLLQSSHLPSKSSQSTQISNQNSPRSYDLGLRKRVEHRREHRSYVLNLRKRNQCKRIQPECFSRGIFFAAA